jgi:hypothetical protein
MVGLKSVRLATSAAILPTEMLKKPLPLGANFRKSPAAALIGEATRPVQFSTVKPLFFMQLT